MAEPEEMLELFSSTARALRVEAPDVLTAIVTQAAQTVPSAVWAGVIELERGRLTPKATLGDPPRVLDRLQQEQNTGPCIDAARDQQVVVVDDTATDRRWPGIAATAVAQGVCSMLCLPLWVDGHRLGTLSLYGEQSHAFAAAERRLAAFYATLAALALADSRRVAQLTLALESRDLIGQAKGILAERLRITPEAAFALLKKTSQDTNQRLVAVAEKLVGTGEWPG
ncbi:GAF and ANTAR domain-containing protein [Actinoplanes sp. LDG1-06]|uniref:GAF and ANTAR domain-containing protein n=1 Tax=Paractinoplanes ovalisporus TaxID=2810368 RepID=A0ABS2ALY3_9ACTN|nr:GAF and ANTAR domain-containing protein [Actinoplanes ovalisporus]MBM2620778.1 GAF and ANTAR domain-containing protein [Actinoplanes ovalisporus]